MRIRAIAFFALAMTAPVAAVGAGGGGNSGATSMGTPRQMTPEEQARASYNQGVRIVRNADRLCKTADEAADEKKKARALERAARQYETARGHFILAVQRQPKMHEAWNYIGYTSRKLGEYDKALAAYDEALRSALLTPKRSSIAARLISA